MIPEHPDLLRKRIAEWANSPEGRLALQETADAVTRTIQQMKDDARIPWEKLHEPTTI